MNTESPPLPGKRRAVATPCRMLHDPQHRAAVLKAASVDALNEEAAA